METEVEVLQLAHHREVGDLDAHAGGWNTVLCDGEPMFTLRLLGDGVFILRLADLRWARMTEHIPPTEAGY